MGSITRKSNCQPFTERTSKTGKSGSHGMDWAKTSFILAERETGGQKRKARIKYLLTYRLPMRKSA